MCKEKEQEALLQEIAQKNENQEEESGGCGCGGCGCGDNR